ncbi:MAG TPA: hydrogenase [Nitratifractor sp.]|nr:hydrogenase [Nitratifractor sp.]
MRLIARFARELEEEFEVITVYESKTVREQVPKEKPVVKTLAHTHPAAIWFERKMHDDFGIEIEESIDTRPLVHQEYFPKDVHPMRKSFQEKEIERDNFKEYPYESIKGDSIFNVSVGPIHAGIIEPGHFHFSQAGENILHLEVRHFYKYRAIEKMLEGKTLQEAKPIIERISGNESIAYQLCWRDIYLQASGTLLPLSMQKEHAMLLEIERITHHLTDLGFIPNDAGFGAALSFASKLSEDTRRKLKELSGSRFGFGAINFDYLDFDRASFYEWLESLEEELLSFEEWITGIPSLWDRLDTTGYLSEEMAVAFDTVGVVARASGVVQDRRADDFYYGNGFTLATEKKGDVAARFKLRVAEVKNSIAMIKSFLETEREAFTIGTIKDGEYFSYAESSLGELFVYIELKGGVIERFFARDASFVNWQALHLMMTKDIIADFPLINKSCDLSYAGNDL